MTKPNILIITASTRQGRFADVVVTWFAGVIANRDDAAYEFVDLRDWTLPYIDQPGYGAQIEAGYEAGSQQALWRDKVSSADGFIIITPEYNHGYPAVLKTALDALSKAWNNKPIAFVSYGGVSGGTRAVEQLRAVAVELQMAPIRNTVAMPFAAMMFRPDGTTDNPMVEKGAVAMLDQLAWWTKALQAARATIAA